MLVMATVGIIPARAGSRGLPGKHLRRIGGRPMIEHTIRAALSARRIDRVIVSTNDPAVARLARRIGAEVPFERPDALAADDTPTAPVTEHAVSWLERNGTPVEIAVTLQPTSPLRGADEIDAVVALLDKRNVRSAVSVAPIGLPASVVGALVAGHFVPMPVGGDARRQAAPPAVRITGGVYATRRDLLAEGKLLDDRPAAFHVDAAGAVDVDDADDLAEARRLMRLRARRR
jgi:CMP-N-acetylneuraminic acid synthetase